MDANTVLPNGLTVAEQAKYDAEYAGYQYDGASHLSGEEVVSAFLADVQTAFRIVKNRERGIITAGEADKKLRDILIAD